MKSQDNTNWYIGQEVVCVDSQGACETQTGKHSGLKEGEIYRIQGLAQGCCHIVLDVGIPSTTSVSYCLNCGKSSPQKTHGWGFRESRFSPLEYNQQAINNLLEVTIVLP